MIPIPRHASIRFLLLCCAIGALLLPAVGRAQILVDLSIKRVLYVAYEPLLATVRITNLSGNPLLLADVESKKWFGFQIETLDGRPIPPRDPNYEIEPVKVSPGESITRTVNLTQLYPLGDFGSYRIRSTVYAAELGGYFSSPPLTVEITEGRLIWQQTVGVPGQMEGMGSSRTISLLSHRLPERTDLYLRIEDKSSGIVYCTHRLGDFLSYGKPEIMLDSVNTIHVLQNSQPRLFVYSKIGLDGKILDRVSLNAPKEKPQLQRSNDGTVVVRGGFPFDPRATPTPGIIQKLSDRPVPLPTPAPVSTPKSKESPLPKNKPATAIKQGSPPPRPISSPAQTD
jgi:hypothetical protein